MNLILTRRKISLDGIFGEIFTETGDFVAFSLEHSYNKSAKVPSGKYICKRSKHKLLSMDHFFETFEVEKVPDCTGILFHTGNYNIDSDGCILLGSKLGSNCILNSREAFKKFMKLQEGVDLFSLTVV